MNMSVALIFFAIHKPDGDRFDLHGRGDVPANFRHKVPKAALLFHVQVVEAGYMATGRNDNMPRC